MSVGFFCILNTHFPAPLERRHAHQHQRDPEGEEPEAVSPQPALPGPESDSSHQPQPLPVCAAEPGAQTRSGRTESEHQHLLQPPSSSHRSVNICQIDRFLSFFLGHSDRFQSVLYPADTLTSTCSIRFMTRGHVQTVKI